MLYIYALREPSSGDIRYIGKTNDLKVRYKSHRVRNLRKHNSGLYDWIHSLREPLLMTVLEVCDSHSWSQKEVEWIGFLRGLGVELFNISRGGSGVLLNHGRRVALSTKEKLRHINAIQFSDPERKIKHREGVRNWFASLPEEKKDHIREVGRRELAKHRDPERSRRQTKARWDEMTPEQRSIFVERRTTKLRERVISPEEHARRSAACKKRSSSLEWKEKFRQIKLRDWAGLTEEERAERVSNIKKSRNP